MAKKEGGDGRWHVEKNAGPRRRPKKRRLKRNNIDSSAAGSGNTRRFLLAHFRPSDFFQPLLN
jgi:hypothetical protein